MPEKNYFVPETVEERMMLSIIKGEMSESSICLLLDINERIRLVKVIDLRR